MINQPYRIVPGHIITPWAADIDPNSPLPEYPRPQMTRADWLNLNGLWAFAITPKNAPQPNQYQGHILVPYPIESALSGVKRPLKPNETLWYHRTFTSDPSCQNGRTLIHFGAVDWHCRLILNGKAVGEHTGGYDPFNFDITPFLKEGENDLVVAVQDPTDSQPIQSGKQVLKPNFIWYSAVSGIWQTVWLEHVPETYIQSIKITPDFDRSRVIIQTQINNSGDQLMVKAEVYDEGNLIAEGQEPGTKNLIIALPEFTPWTPENPHLYDLKVTLLSNDIVVDQVTSYFGMRKFSLKRVKGSILRFCLNNEPYFLYGPLDQGYWPDGLYTPPSDQAMLWDIRLLKKAGFNMLRKHVKVEPARYYYHCDREGVIVWQDMVSGGISPRPIWFFFANLFKNIRDDRSFWRLGRADSDNRAYFEIEYQRMLDALHNVVSIAIWGPFNEGWGQFDAARIANWTKRHDRTRLVDHASGWFDQEDGDFKSEHIYFKPLPEPVIDPNRAWVLSEFGGYSLNLQDHAWNPRKDFGYKKFTNKDDLTSGYIELLQKELIPWIRAGLSAAVYTQTSDVETEVNGLVTYDRMVIKMDLDAIRAVHQELYAHGEERNPPSNQV